MVLTKKSLFEETGDQDLVVHALLDDGKPSCLADDDITRSNFPLGPCHLDNGKAIARRRRGGGGPKSEYRKRLPLSQLRASSSFIFALRSRGAFSSSKRGAGRNAANLRFNMKSHIEI